jgi:hypothetical protein
VRRCLLLAFASVLLVGFVASCSGGGGNTESESWHSCKRSAGTVGHDTGPRDVVLRIYESGGLPAPSFMPDPVPELTLYGDGSLVGTDPATAGQLVPRLAKHRLTEPELQRLLHDAEAACLFEGDSLLDLPGTYDVPGVAFEAKTGLTSHTTFAIGLGSSEMEKNVPDEQIEQRAALIEFLNHALVFLQVAKPLPADRIGVFFTKLDGPPASGDWPVVEWPLGEPLASYGTASSEAYPDVHCAIATGAGARTLLAEVEGMRSDRLPYWRDGDSWYNLQLRPMLPDELDCSALVA